MTVRVGWTVHEIRDGRERQRGDVRIDADRQPAPAVLSSGLAGAPRHRAWVDRDDGRPVPRP